MLRAVRRRRRWRHYPRRRRSDMRDVADLHPADRRSVVRFPRDIFSDLSESFQPETSIEQNHMARQGHLTSMYGYGGWKPTLPLDKNKICFVSSHHHESVARMQEPAPGWEFGQQNRENNPSYLSSGVPVDDTELLVLADLICGLKSITDPAEEPLKWAEDAAKIVFEMTVHKDKEILLPDTAEQEPEGIGIGAPSASEKDRAGGFGKTDDGDGGKSLKDVFVDGGAGGLLQRDGGDGGDTDKANVGHRRYERVEGHENRTGDEVQIPSLLYNMLVLSLMHPSSSVKLSDVWQKYKQPTRAKRAFENHLISTALGEHHNRHKTIRVEREDFTSVLVF